MVKKIFLTQRKVTFVDDGDFDELNKYKWYADKDTKNGMWYAKRNVPLHRGKIIRMHRQIMKFPSDRIDHKNGDGLDNRRCNLRICTHSQNIFNSGLRKNNTTGFKGITWDKNHQKWKSRICNIHIGYFNNKEDAARAYDEQAKELFAEFAVFNFPELHSESMKKLKKWEKTEKFEVDKKLQKKLSNLFKKDRNRCEMIFGKINEIIKCENLTQYRNLRAPLQRYKEAHVNSHFILIFQYMESSDTIKFWKFCHHNELFKW